jgi:hypothetical protein
LLYPDKFTIPERIEFIFERKKGEKKEREREGSSWQKKLRSR